MSLLMPSETSQPDLALEPRLEPVLERCQERPRPQEVLARGRRQPAASWRRRIRSAGPKCKMQNEKGKSRNAKSKRQNAKRSKPTPNCRRTVDGRRLVVAFLPSAFLHFAF
jgi:hypothetical protein